MIRHLLIPLDGSTLAEIVLPYAKTLFKVFHPKVTLIHMLEKDPPGTIHGEKHLATENEALEYLDGITEKWFPKEAVVVCHVHTDVVENVADSLADHIAELEPDLVLMCAHGRGGWRDFTVGNLAQQVIGRIGIPVILIKNDTKPQGRLSSFLVCLDGTPEHEQVLPAAIELGKGLNAKIAILMAVHTRSSLPGSDGETGRLLPGTTRAVLDATEEYAYQYLEKKARLFEEAGLMVTILVPRGDPAQEILEASRQGKYDLLVVGTHGKAGLGAFWAGSVGAKVINSSTIPLLMTPAKKDAL